MFLKLSKFAHTLVVLEFGFSSTLIFSTLNILFSIVVLLVRIVNTIARQIKICQHLVPLVFNSYFPIFMDSIKITDITTFFLFIFVYDYNVMTIN